MNTEKQINRYVSLLYEPTDRVALCLIREQAVQHRFTAVRNIGRFISFLKAMNCQGWNIYITPSILKTGAVRRTKTDFMLQQNVIYADADNKKAMEKVRAEYPYPTLVVKTSIGHYHIYWKLDKKISVEEQEDIMKRVAKNIGSDPAATDVSRVLRLPGFWHKGKDNTVDIVFSGDEKVAYKSFPSFLPRQTASELSEKNTRAEMQAQASVFFVKNIGFSKIYTGKEKLVFPSRSEEDWYLVNKWLLQGIEREECIQRLKVCRAGEKKNVDYYAKKTLENALEKGWWRKVKNIY